MENDNALLDIDFAKVENASDKIVVDVIDEENAEIQKENIVDKNKESINKDKKLLIVDTPEEEVEVKDNDDVSKDKKDKTIQLEPFVMSLKEEGILQDFDEEEYSKLSDSKEKSSYILKNIDTRIQKSIEEGMKKNDVFVQDIYAQLEKGVDYDDVMSIKKTQKTLDNITDKDIDDDESIQESLVRQHYKLTTSFNDAKIDKIIKDKKSTSELGTEAKESIVNLKSIYKNIEKEQIAKAVLDNKKIQEKKDEDLKKLKEDIFATKEIITGVPLNKKDQEVVLNYMTVPVAYDANNNPISKAMEVFQKDPVGANKKLAYLIHLGVFDKDTPRWDKILEVKKKTITDFLDKELNKTTVNMYGKVVNKNNDNRKTEDALKGFPM